MDLALSSPVQYVPRVGPKLAQKLDKLGVKIVEDLLYYVPFRYNDFSLVSPVNRVQPGETVTVQGKVVSMKNAFTKTGKKLQQARIADESGAIDVVWFNQMYLTKIIKPGDAIHLSGKVDWFGHKIVMISPEYEISEGESLHTGRLVPVYSETAGLSSKWLRGRIAYTLETCLGQVKEFLPERTLVQNKLMGLDEAIRSIHFPKSLEEADNARRRLAFDELFILQLRAREQKRLWQETKKSHVIRLLQTDASAFTGSLPFELTVDQKQALKDILADLQRPVPMNRLLEGDVGTGKTVLAAGAMYAVNRNGFRSLLMAPTEILALQHYQTLFQFLSKLGLTVGLLTGSHKEEKNRSFDVLVGTHALLAKAATFKNVGLIVIDEQQRFGVHQRALLSQKAESKKTPHTLTMTATPIPRTVARTIYGNLDLSVLADMPKGRSRIKTWLVPKEKREKAYQWIRKQLALDHSQAFIVCPFIEESETLVSVKSVKAEYARLKTVFPDLSLGLLHGRMKAREKTQALDRFRAGKDAILLATPVVEVGIDVPNATIIVIEAAERFGLAQLHQLRGRVGRGRIASFCLLFTEQEDEDTLQRLKAMETTRSGPELAEIDLTIRGPGELFGTRQHGIPELRVARISDTQAIAQTQKAVATVVATSPTLSQFPLLRQKLENSTIRGALQD